MSREIPARVEGFSLELWRSPHEFAGFLHEWGKLPYNALTSSVRMKWTNASTMFSCSESS